MNAKNKNEEGIVLVLSLILLGVVTAVGVGISLIVVNEVQSSIQVDESIVATYAAEAKVEEALEVIRTARITTGYTLDQTVSDIQALTGPVSITTTAGSVTAQVSMSQTSSGQSFLLTSLAQDQSVQFDVQSPICFGVPTDDSCVRSVTISGQRLNASGTEPWLELTEVAFSGSATGETSVKKELLPESGFLSEANPATYNFVGNPPDTIATDVQTVRLTALYNGVKNLEIRAFTDTNPAVNCGSTPCESDILGHININAIGTFGGSRIGVSATVPWRLPSSGLFDYVLFSEETVKQN